MKNTYEGIYFGKNRSSHRRCSVKKGVLRNFAKFTGKDLCQSLFFNKVAGLGEDEIKGIFHDFKGHSIKQRTQFFLEGESPTLS